ncbi:uncharacterized protein CTHT_0044860 [Thermochaetoides thermophila DSM 1495]|uniref:NACHT domain-containing protein n=1 Tax=Chaetomium thermophilum (strain DSM 1495 / CBS 144.50 / IMI 039719) TaxID=759272 RepID=G0S979_CHATD|nr:hypothetical protein CTHT_0044860 [Thermochaetoides thermophila DSM 1495]EGS19990.1 hypothetical protein CTHT_0044860 [Thermochaetoides thermophila DSM 1495]
MGGLVIKKAFVLACHQNKKLAERVRAIYFIATPHRGADLAKTLKNILQLVFSAPSYVVELIPGSDVLQAINDDFRQHAEGLELCSFYETRQFRAGIGISALVVDPESARLGYPREKQYPMNADHRSICKFDSPKDENYRIVRNALASTVQNIRDTVNTAETQASPRQDQMETLAEYLGVVDEVMNDLADDLADIRELRLPGTFLSGFIVDDLEVSDAAYSYYFFKHGDRSKSALSTCLRSLAFQMASLDPGIRDLFLKLHSSRVKVDYGNERSLWRTFFAPKVFKEATVQHFWVIDALDECSNFAPLLESMLSKMENDGRLRILITSRETPELCRLFSTLGPGKHFTAHISPEETLSDIKRLVEHKRSALCTLDEETRQILEKRIIEKSKGSFLWTVLVLEELSKSYIRRDVETVLEEVPRGMGQLYYRALEAMAVATRGKELAKALLTWTACVIRPLTLAELQAALEIDLRDKIANMKETIRTLCGQLLVIDKQERVQMVHETAREFLLDTQLGRARISELKGSKEVGFFPLCQYDVLNSSRQGQSNVG